MGRDWRDHNLVNPVQNQGSCGSCWAFSTIVSIEGAHVVMRDPFTGVIMQAWGGKTGHGDGEVDFPHDIEVIYGDNGAGGAAKSRVFVTELDNPRVQQWTASLDVAWGDARYLDSGGR